MAEKLSADEIRQYWAAQVLKYESAPATSWSDVWAIDLEIREIIKWLDDGDRVLDVGCGNGYSTLQFAARKRIDVRGVDYVPEMIAQARARADTFAGRLTGTVEFALGDATALNEPADTYDKFISIRVNINLGDWERQRAALRAWGHVTKPGGLLLLSEATLQGWNKLNAFRKEWHLPPIPMPAFNTYLDEDRVIETMAEHFELVDLVNFSSTYFVATRVLKPLLAKALNADVNVADPELHWNRWWAQTPAFGDYGTQKLFVFRKR